MKIARCILIALFILSPFDAVVAQEDAVDFESERWLKTNAQIVDHLGRKALMGNAYLTDVEFEDGVIEVDIAVTGARTYPGLAFRAQSPGNYEHFYIRPHRAGLYPDALQYAPVINGISCWQLYNGAGYTAAGEFPENEWMHLKLDVRGTQARVFIDDMDNPALVIDRLQHGVSKGSIGVEGPADGTAYFSNFRYRNDDDLTFIPAPRVETPPGMITDWEISPATKISDIDPEAYPGDRKLESIEWLKVHCDPSGLVNVARYVTRTGREPDCIIARTKIRSDRKETRKYVFGYSDYVSVFLNGKILFAGESAYTQRDPSFLGIVGLFDAVYLPLVEGDNELLFIVTESFGGWGFMCRDPEAVFVHEEMKSVWKTNDEFLFPESAVYDPKRNVVYVSNYDGFNRADATGGQFISKLSPEGKTLEREWVKGLRRPAGMVIVGGTLHVSERTGLAEIDIETGEVTARHPIPRPRFPNDVVADAAGNLYVSDSGKHVIYRFANGEFEEWLDGPEIDQPNGLLVDDNELIVGNTGDNSLKRVDLASKRIAVIARLEPGIIDGIKKDKRGNYIVSHGEGRVYRIAPGGDVTKLLDTTGPTQFTADFDYIGKRNLLVIPTYYDGRVVAYRLE